MDILIKELNNLEYLGNVKYKIQVLIDAISYFKNEENLKDILYYDRSVLFNHWEEQLKTDCECCHPRVKLRRIARNEYICETGNLHLLEFDEKYNLENQEYLTNPFTGKDSDSESS